MKIFRVVVYWELKLVVVAQLELVGLLLELLLFELVCLLLELFDMRQLPVHVHVHVRAVLR